MATQPPVMVWLRFSLCIFLKLSFLYIFCGGSDIEAPVNEEMLNKCHDYLIQLKEKAEVKNQEPEVINNIEMSITLAEARIEPLAEKAEKARIDELKQKTTLVMGGHKKAKPAAEEPPKKKRFPGLLSRKRRSTSSLAERAKKKRRSTILPKKRASTDIDLRGSKRRRSIKGILTTKTTE